MSDDKLALEGIDEVLGDEVTETWRGALASAIEDFGAEKALYGMLAVAAAATVGGLGREGAAILLRQLSEEVRDGEEITIPLSPDLKRGR